MGFTVIEVLSWAGFVLIGTVGLVVVESAISKLWKRMRRTKNYN